MSKCRIHGSVCNNEFLDRGGDCIRTRSRKYEGPFKECLYEELSILDKQLRASEAENRWIPVSEEPKEEGKYVVVIQDYCKETHPDYSWQAAKWVDGQWRELNLNTLPFHVVCYRPIILPEQESKE